MTRGGRRIDTRSYAGRPQLNRDPLGSVTIQRERSNFVRLAACAAGLSAALYQAVHVVWVYRIEAPWGFIFVAASVAVAEAVVSISYARIPGSKSLVLFLILFFIFGAHDLTRFLAFHSYPEFLPHMLLSHWGFLFASPLAFLLGLLSLPRWRRSATT